MPLNYGSNFRLKNTVNGGYLGKSPNGTYPGVRPSPDDEAILYFHLKSDVKDRSPVRLNTELGIFFWSGYSYLSLPGNLQYRFMGHLKGDETFRLIDENDPDSTAVVDFGSTFGVLCGKHYMSWDGSATWGELDAKKHFLAYERWTVVT